MKTLHILVLVALAGACGSGWGYMVDENPDYSRRIQVQQTQLVQIQNNYNQACNALQTSPLDDAIRREKLALLQQQYQAQCVIINNEIAKLQTEAKAIADENARRQQEFQAKAETAARDEQRREQEHQASMALARQEARKNADEQRARDDEEYEKRTATDAQAELSSAHQYRDAKEWLKAKAAFERVLTLRKGKPEAATADIELAAMLKDPGAVSVIAALADEKNQKECAGWLRTAKLFLANKETHDNAPQYLKRIIKAAPGGDIQAEAQTMLKEFDHE